VLQVTLAREAGEAPAVRGSAVVYKDQSLGGILISRLAEARARGGAEGPCLPRQSSAGV